MIGVVTWPDPEGGHHPVTATLEDDRTFTVRGAGPAWNARGWARDLELECRDSYGGPSDGAYGHRFLAELAAKVGGTVAFAPKREQPPGTVY